MRPLLGFQLRREFFVEAGEVQIQAAQKSQRGDQQQGRQRPRFMQEYARAFAQSAGGNINGQQPRCLSNGRHHQRMFAAGAAQTGMP